MPWPDSISAIPETVKSFINGCSLASLLSRASIPRRRKAFHPGGKSLRIYCRESVKAWIILPRPASFRTGLSGQAK